MTEDTKKFLFHLHNFGEPEEEDGPPPPPMFNEDELGQAKKEAYEKGKKDGFQDSQASIEKKISILLDNATRSFLDLQSNELARERRYEEEAVNLALIMFKTIFPAWSKEKGPKEIEQVIEKILKNASNLQTIEVLVHSDLLPSMEERFRSLLETLSNIHVTFEAHEGLSEGDMRMSWKNGGAVRDSNALSEHILQILEDGLPTKDKDGEVLADSAETRHNEIESTETPDE